MSRNLVTGEHIGQDRHIRSYGRGPGLGEWRFSDRGVEMLYEVNADDDGHVTVTCHCERCEAERATARPVSK